MKWNEKKRGKHDGETLSYTPMNNDEKKLQMDFWIVLRPVLLSIDWQMFVSFFVFVKREQVGNILIVLICDTRVKFNRQRYANESASHDLDCDYQPNVT